MRRRAARVTHLALFTVGVVLYVVFVIPRWWVFTGDIPATAATFGRVITGLPIVAAAVPVVLTLQRSLKDESLLPALALRLRAWSAVLHVIAGMLIVVTAVAEIWLRSPAAAPWLFGVYGGAGALAVVATLAFVLSFPAELPPAPAKPAKVKPPKKSAGAPKQRRTRGRRKRGAQEADQEAEVSDQEAGEDTAAAEPDEDESTQDEPTHEGPEDTDADTGSTEQEQESVPEDATPDDATPDDATPQNEAESPADDPSDGESPSADSGSGDQRPVGKKRRHRLPR